MDPVIEQRDLLYRSQRCDVSRTVWRLANGARAERPIVTSPGAVAIVARPAADRVAMVRQYRYALGAWTIELPAGTRGAGEAALDCARRELLEEAGYRAEAWRELLNYHPAPGLTDEMMTVFQADELSEVGNRPEADEDLAVEVMSDATLHRHLREGAITDAKTLIGLALCGIRFETDAC